MEEGVQRLSDSNLPVKTTLEQRLAIMQRIRDLNPNWKEIRPEILYHQLIKRGLMKLVRRRGKPPEIRWL